MDWHAVSRRLRHVRQVFDRHSRAKNCQASSFKVSSVIPFDLTFPRLCSLLDCALPCPRLLGWWTSNQMDPNWMRHFHLKRYVSQQLLIIVLLVLQFTPAVITAIEGLLQGLVNLSLWQSFFSYVKSKLKRFSQSLPSSTSSYPFSICHYQVANVKEWSHGGGTNSKGQGPGLDCVTAAQGTLFRWRPQNFGIFLHPSSLPLLFWWVIGADPPILNTKNQNLIKWNLYVLKLPILTSLINLFSHACGDLFFMP